MVDDAPHGARPRSAASDIAASSCRHAAHGGVGQRRAARRWLLDHRDLGPRRAGAAEQPALREVDLALAQHLELLAALDALGDDDGADLAGEGPQRAQQRLAVGVLVDVGDEAAGELEEVRAQLDDVLERRVAGAGVVDRDLGAAGDPRRELLAQLGVVGDVASAR